MNREQINKIISLLESASKRPAMYMGVVSVEVADAWLHGFNACLWTLDLTLPDGIRSQVEMEHGWDTNSALGMAHQLQKRGITDEAGVDSLFEIEIEAWKRLAHKMDAGEIRL